MSLLTDDECRDIHNAAMALPNRSIVSATRYIETAIMAKLAQGASLEPVALDYPGDSAAFKWSKLPFQYCSCVGRGSDDTHQAGRKFWETLMKARAMWRDAHVLAWSCASKAKGGKPCKEWCGHQTHCTAAMKVRPDSIFTLDQLTAAIAAARVQALSKAMELPQIKGNLIAEKAIRALIGKEST